MQRARSAKHFDDIDTVPSKHETGPWGPIIVVVAVRDQQHVCWCGEPFVDGHPELKPVEVKCGGTVPVLLHAKCAGQERSRSFRSFHDIMRGLQARRFYAKSVKPFNHHVTGEEAPAKTGE